MARRTVKRRGGGQVQGFLEEDTWLIRGNCYIQAFSPDVLYYCCFLAYPWIYMCWYIAKELECTKVVLPHVIDELG